MLRFSKKTIERLGAISSSVGTLAAHKHASTLLFCAAFIESSLFPVPPIVMLAPMVLLVPSKAWFYGAVCTVGSILGALFGYLIGYLLFENVGKELIEVYGYSRVYTSLADGFREWSYWILILKGVTPFPYQVASIFSGAVKLDLSAFLIATVIARTIRYFAMVALIYYARRFVLTYLWRP